MRLGRSTARLLPRLEPGDIAVLDHLDLDAATAQALVACGVAGVVNASPSTSGRFPNLGPAVLLDAQVPLLDGVGPDVFDSLREGRRARFEGDGLWVGDSCVATGVRQDADSVASTAAFARAGLAAQLADLTANATGFLLDERDLLLEGVGIPAVRTDLAGRAVLVVAAGPRAAEELARLRRFRRTHQPLVIGVEAGADLLLGRRSGPDLVLGDPVLLSDAALLRAGEVVTRPGAEDRLEDLGVTAVPFRTTAASEDMALLLAVAAGAAVVVAVGFPTTYAQLLDRGRAGASSSMLIRAGVGERIVSARAAAALCRRRAALWPSLLALVAGASAGALATQDVDLTGAVTRWLQLCTGIGQHLSL